MPFLQALLALATSLLATTPVAQAAASNPGTFSNDTATHQIQSGGLTRHYAIWIPNNYSSSTPSKLIFDYHGNTNTPWDQYDNSQYYRFSEAQAYIVVYPQGHHLSWQGANYSDPRVNDLQFTTDLLAHIKATYCIDEAHIYASGKSNGGGFVDLLACSDAGDAFAAFAMSSAALYTDNSLGACSKSRAILESHGDMDGVVPYTGGPGNGGMLPNIDEWISWWGTRDCGADATPTHTFADGYNTTMYSCNGRADVVSHYQIYDLGHCWPCDTKDNFDATTGDQNKRKCLDTALSYTPKVLAFFAQWNAGNKP